MMRRLDQLVLLGLYWDLRRVIEPRRNLDQRLLLISFILYASATLLVIAEPGGAATESHDTDVLVKGLPQGGLALPVA